MLPANFQIQSSDFVLKMQLRDIVARSRLKLEIISIFELGSAAVVAIRVV
jgi:hypothetical protein